MQLAECQRRVEELQGELEERTAAHVAALETMQAAHEQVRKVKQPRRD